MSRFFRGAFILSVVWRFGLDQLVLSSFGPAWLRAWATRLSLGRDLSAPRGARLRQAFEQPVSYTHLTLPTIYSV